MKFCSDPGSILHSACSKCLWLLRELPSLSNNERCDPENAGFPPEKSKEFALFSLAIYPILFLPRCSSLGLAVYCFSTQAHVQGVTYKNYKHLSKCSGQVRKYHKKGSKQDVRVTLSNTVANCSSYM